jgi:DNA processing protein
MKEIQTVELGDAAYPESLVNIPDPPEILYCTGDVSLLSEISAAVVGSRKHTLYGKMTARMIGSELAGAGITVVSGLAAGIDTFAQTGALDAGGRVIAVLGTAIDRTYPARNASVRERIEENGLVVSEYPPGMMCGRYSFPRRNRIISGLAEVVVIVEAGMNSGSLITAAHANEQGKTIYAVPGNINSQFSIGTNLLIRDGAKPLVVMSDMLADLGVSGTEGINNKEEKLGDDERKIFDFVARNEGAAVDSIARGLGMKTSHVNAVLTVLEIKGAVATYCGKIFLAK